MRGVGEIGKSYWLPRVGVGASVMGKWVRGDVGSVGYQGWGRVWWGDGRGETSGGQQWERLSGGERVGEMGIYRRGREGRGHRVNVPLHHPITHAWGQTQNEAPSAQSRHTHPDKVIEFPVYFPGITKTSVRYRVMFLLHCPVTHSQSKFGVWSSLYTAPSLSLGTGGIFAPSSPLLRILPSLLASCQSSATISSSEAWSGGRVRRLLARMLVMPGQFAISPLTPCTVTPVPSRFTCTTLV